MSFLDLKNGLQQRLNVSNDDILIQNDMCLLGKNATTALQAALDTFNDEQPSDWVSSQNFIGKSASLGRVIVMDLGGPLAVAVQDGAAANQSVGWLNRQAVKGMCDRTLEALTDALSAGEFYCRNVDRDCFSEAPTYLQLMRGEKAIREANKMIDVCERDLINLRLNKSLNRGQNPDTLVA